MKEKVSEANEELVQKERTTIRFNSRDKLVKKLKDVYGNRYSRDIFAKANQLLDKELKEQEHYLGEYLKEYRKNTKILRKKE